MYTSRKKSDQKKRKKEKENFKEKKPQTDKGAIEMFTRGKFRE